ncbi:hypothetical protein FKB34_01830 [Glycocaulis profundi]|nr:hypothetical protein FKB34_01830 [Glycocaulis profundi]
MEGIDWNLYNSTALTTQVNRVPNTFGLINALGYFTHESIGSTVVEIREESDGIAVLAAEERGGPAQQMDGEEGATRFVKVPHFPVEDAVTPRDVQDRLAVLGRERVAESVDGAVAKKLLRLASAHYLTQEYTLTGAIKGRIYDGKGRLLLDLHQYFDRPQRTIYWDLDNPDTDPWEKAEEVYDAVGDEKNGISFMGVDQIASPAFVQKLIKHPKFEQWYLNYSSGVGLAREMERETRGGNWGRIIPIGQLRLIEYKGKVKLKGAGVVPFVELGKGHALPTGVSEPIFECSHAPADVLEQVNIPPALLDAAASLPEGSPLAAGILAMYASAKIRDHNKGLDLWSESNNIAICKRPELLVESDMGANPNP